MAQAAVLLLQSHCQWVPDCLSEISCRTRRTLEAGGIRHVKISPECECPDNQRCFGKLSFARTSAPQFVPSQRSSVEAVRLSVIFRSVAMIQWSPKRRWSSEIDNSATPRSVLNIRGFRVRRYLCPMGRHR